MRCARLAVALAIVSLVLAASGARADVSVAARLDRSQTGVGEAADLAVEIRGAQNVPPPAIASADGVQIRYVGPSTQISIVNGQTNAAVTHHFSVVAARPGTFTIGPITVDYQGKRYDAGSVTLTASAAARPGGAPPAAGNPIQLELSAPKTTVYLHERVPVGVKLSIGAVRVSDVAYPIIAGEGFALDKFPEPAQHQERGPQGVVEVADFRTVLTPLRSGPLTVGPAKITLSVMVPSRRSRDPFFDQFFGGDPFAPQRPAEIESQALELDVLPLPEQGKPADFSGAVGSFQFDVKAAPLDLQAGDPVTLTFKIRGTGNLENLRTPQVVGSDALRVYPVQQTSAAPPPTGAPARPGGAAPPRPLPGGTEEKVFEQVVIPQRAGPLTIPEIRFSYFDPSAGAYRTIAQPPLAVTVRAPAQAVAPPRIVGSAPSAPRTETLGRDIVFIKDAPGSFQPRGARRWRSVIFWAFQPLPLLAWLTVVVYDRQRQRLRGDASYARFTRAGRQARRALDAARTALRAGKPEPFYDTVARAMSDYLSAKLDLPPGTVTADTVVERLRARGLASPLADELHEFFATCERVRFAPSADGDGSMQRTLERAAGIIRRLERERRLTRPTAAVALLATIGLVATAVLGHAADPAGAPAPPAAADKSPAALFFHAGELYGEERYQEAAAEYEKVLAAGYESAPLYFNLGNAYFKIGDVGRAVLEYERARRLAPRDPDVAVNLAYAREPSGETGELPLPARLLFPLAERLSGDETLLATSTAYTLLMLVLIAARLAPRLQRAARALAGALGLVLFVLATSGAYRLVVLDLPRYAVLVAHEGRAVRFEPSTSGTEHFRVQPGSVLRVLGEREGWTQVARHDGTRGWVEDTALEQL